MASSTLVPFLRLAMLFKCLLEPATVLQKKKKEKKGTEELPWVSKVGHFHFHESGIFRPLCLVVHNATNRTVPKHSTKCPLGFEFRWFVSGLSFVFLFVRFCYCCLVVVVVVASPPNHLSHTYTFIYNVHFNYHKDDIGIIHFINLLAYVGLMTKIYIPVILVYLYQTFHYKFLPLF